MIRLSPRPSNDPGRGRPRVTAVARPTSRAFAPLYTPRYGLAPYSGIRSQCTGHTAFPSSPLQRAYRGADSELRGQMAGQTLSPGRLSDRLTSGQAKGLCSYTHRVVHRAAKRSREGRQPPNRHQWRPARLVRQGPIRPEAPLVGTASHCGQARQWPRWGLSVDVQRLCQGNGPAIMSVVAVSSQ